MRWHLFPEIRISPPEQQVLAELESEVSEDPKADAHEPGEVILLWSQAIDDASVAEDGKASLFPNVIRIMDLEQERLARSLGEGHRVIHGVAGSGKTLILGYRCLHLASLVLKPILVICFNVTLAARLRGLISAHDIDQGEHVRHFHDLCGEQLRTYHVVRPVPGSGYVAALVQCVIDAAATGRIPRTQYGAVLIDEGHDFEPDWLRLVVSMIDPDSNSLMLLYDDAQPIYAERALDFSLSSVGVQARGRTTVLRVNYRNTEEILAFAYHFARHWLSPDDVDDEFVPTLKPESAGRHGPEPVVVVRDSFEAEAQLVARCVMKQHAQGASWSDICITYRANWMGEILNRELAAAGAPLHWLKTTADKKRLSTGDPTVKLMTMHSSKGLEFPMVIVSGVGTMPDTRSDVTSEAKLLYVAMTRATEKLLVTAHRSSDFVTRLAA